MRFWYLLGVLFKISDDHPRHFYTGVPPTGTVMHCSVLKSMRSLRLTQAITINGNLHEDRIVLTIVSSIDLLVFGELRSTEAGVLFQLGSAKERLVLWTRVRFDAEFKMFALRVVFVLIQKVEGDSVVERPFQQTVERT